MNKQEIIAFINKNPVFFLGTAEGDQPHVRGMLMYSADENGVIFHTGDFKDLPKQLANNNKVELCFNDLKANVQVRICGTTEELKDAALKKEILAKRPFMKAWIEKAGMESLLVFRVKCSRAHIWTFNTNFEPIETVEL